MEEFITPKNHINFLAKKLFENGGKIIDVSIAYLEKNGGGPVELHTHPHDHLFITVEGEAKIILDKQEIILTQNNSYLVKGSIPHSIWNNINKQTKMIGISIK